MIILLSEKTRACLKHEPGSVKPEKSRFIVRCREVLNTLYLIVFILLNAYRQTSIFKHDLFQVRGFVKYFKQIHTNASVINKKVFFEKLLFSKIIFDF